MSSTLPVPLKDVVLDYQTGAFVAEGDDPQMLWTCPRARADIQARGAVSVTIATETTQGRLDPIVYADWGDGFSDETQQNLALVSAGVYRGVLYSNAGSLKRLRFDPAGESCAFRLLSFVVEPAAEAAHPTVRISRPRRWIRTVLRRLPPSLQTYARRAADQARALFAGDMQSLGMALTTSRAWRESYEHAFNVARNLRSPFFAAPPLTPPRRAHDGPRVLAFYLPQFHPIPENDRWWAPGFTEWANVTKATPQFTGHLQPRLPAQFGHYDLRVPEVRRMQVDLAKNFGVDGFCFHYYWFAGKRLLERPLDEFVEDPALDFPFCLCWANENWTRRWDGQENDLLIGQKHSLEDDFAVIDDLSRYMRSPRYIRVDGRPFILIYRPDSLPDAKATLARWRERARSSGLGELFIACTNAFGFEAFAAAGFDALVEFPPHALAVGEITNKVELLNPDYGGRIYDYQTVVRARTSDLLGPTPFRHIPGVMPSWDNEARKPGGGNVFHNASPQLFYDWVRAALTASNNSRPPAERLVFVNAWNEWAEGAYLEPDRWFGHGFGQALRSALEEDAPRLKQQHGRAEVVLKDGARAPAIILLHLYYSELISEFAARLKPLDGLADLAISFPDVWTLKEVDQLLNAFPAARIAPYPNRGRDVAPFISELRWASEQGYAAFCKIHSKRSPHMSDGDAWRDTLLTPLLKDAAGTTSAFQSSDGPGMIAAQTARRTLGDHGVMHNNTEALNILADRIGFTYDDDTTFPAGTMFWGKTVAFKPLIDAQALPFEVELGRIDGTLAHAAERAMGAIVAASGHRIDWTLV